ncbi:hypothetical protein ACFYOH_44110, partial [Streptomyces sp. NPDC007856]
PVPAQEPPSAADLAFAALTGGTAVQHGLAPSEGTTGAREDRLPAPGPLEEPEPGPQSHDAGPQHDTSTEPVPPQGQDGATTGKDTHTVVSDAGETPSSPYDAWNELVHRDSRMAELVLVSTRALLKQDENTPSATGETRAVPDERIHRVYARLTARQRAYAAEAQADLLYRLVRTDTTEVVLGEEHPV